MGNITHKFEIQSKPRESGCHAIYFRVTENGIPRKMAIGVHVQRYENFNANAKHGAWISTKEPLGKVFNSKMEDVVLKFYKIERELARREELSAENIIKTLKGDDSDSLIAYLDKKIDQLMKLKKFSSADSRTALKKHLQRFKKNRDIRFKDVTASFVEEFELFLSTHPSSNGKPLKQNSINKSLVILKAVYNRAVTDNLVTSTKDPFVKMKTKATVVHKPYLTHAEVDRIEALDLERGSLLWHIRNYFMFAIYAAGIRVGDLITLKWRNVEAGRLRYIMRKTGSPQNIRLVKKAATILDLYRISGSTLDDYIFPIMGATKFEKRGKIYDNKDYLGYNLVKSKVSILNSNVKKLMALAEIEKSVSFHVARHTFAHWFSEATGNIKELKDVMCHSSYATTEQYLRGAGLLTNDDLILRTLDE